MLNKLKGTFSNDRFWVKGILIVLFPTLFLFLSTVLCLGFFKITGIDNIKAQTYVMQFLSAVLVFLASSLILGVLFSRNPRKLLGMEEGNGMAILLSVFIALVSIPLTNYLTVINERIVPDTWGLINNLETRNDDLIRSMLSNMGFGTLLLNLFIMALLPAVGEEVFFRGMLLGTMNRSIKNHHISVWLTALAFSLVHLQMGKVIPILLMGALFGYMRIWSKSLTLPIAAHFTNNSVIVIYYYFFKGEIYGVNPENIGTSGTPWILLVFTILFVALLFDIRKLAKIGPRRDDLQ